MTGTAFLFKSYAFDKRTHVLRLTYAFEDGPSFEEIIAFPPSDRLLSDSEEDALDRVFRILFLLAGVSYYKTRVPYVLDCAAFPLPEEIAGFARKVYLHGLGEFAYKNKLDLRGSLAFKAVDCEMPCPVILKKTGKLLVPVGGGKDSIVTIETLKKAGEDIVLFALSSKDGLADPIVQTVQASGLPCLVVKRTLSSNLIEMNKQGALNGHVPITAILSAIAVATAILHGCGDVLLSNESSANAANICIDGFEINHQYSKSLDFEDDFSAILRDYVSPDIGYFSFLRPLTETEIARRFADLEEYHALFRSCNAAFRQSRADRNDRWCCTCPKCRFVFLALAPFMDKLKLISIFGLNLLDDQGQIDGYRALCGLTAFKPFECVGDIEECKRLIFALSRSLAWQDDCVIRRIEDELGGAPSDCDIGIKALSAFAPDHRLPQKFERILRHA